MGIRLASLRRTNVVMAPACTCIIFVQDFSKSVGYRLHRISVRAGDNSKKCCKHLQLMFVVKIIPIFVIKQTDRHIICDEIFGCVFVTRLCDALNYVRFDKCSFVVFVRIMNKSGSMGDQTDMGLQKIDMPTFDRSITVKEKRCTPPIDILSNFEREMCRNGNNFQQDCEEFLKIMATNAEKANVNVPNGQTCSEGTEIASFERELLNQVADINMEEEHVRDHANRLNASSYSEACDESRKRCLQMERRIDRLTRRLKLKQSKLYGMHVSEQMSSLLDFCRCKYADQPSLHSTVPMDIYIKRLERCSAQSCMPQNNEKFLRYFGSGTKETKNGRSIGSTVAPQFNDDVHEHIETISGQLHAQIKAITNDFDSDVTASSSGSDSLDEESTLPPDSIEDRSKKIPLSKRALWRWLRNRASIAYRLSWLQSHMSALEYKIHHYTELYKKLRNTKGQVILQNTNEPTARSLNAKNTTATTTGNAAHVVLNGFHGSLAAIDGGSGDATIDADECLPHLKIETDDVTGSDGLTFYESNEPCSRTRPLVKAKFKKRNLVMVDAPRMGTAAGYHKYATVRCDCVSPLSCVLCASRGPGVDLSYQHVLANLLPVQSKIALLEPTYHPVLSFPSDVSLGTHISALLNNDDVLDVCSKTIENRTIAQMSVKRHYSNYKSTDEIRRANLDGQDFKRRKKYVRRQPNNSQAVAYGRSQLGKQRHSKLDKTLSFRKRRRKRIRTKRFTGKDNGIDESPDEGLYYKKDDVYSSQPGSPHSSHSSTVKDPVRRKRGQSYDIDNFIIPPNSTPAVVASKPQYKEILIPTWRVVEDRSIKAENFDRSSLLPHILEDLSDEKVTKLHEALELSEKKKFRTNPTRNKTGVNRGRKRTDSCPETSEANTPERVLSPVSSNMDTNEVSMPPINIIPSNQSTVISNKVKVPPLNKTKTNLDCDNSVVTEPTSAELTPYELREFPLSEDALKEILVSQINKVDEVDEDVDNSNEMKPNENEIREESHSAESTNSISEEDPDDPDWILKDDGVDGRPTELTRK